MRGFAVLAAGASVWVLRARRSRHLPSLSLRAAARRLRPPRWAMWSLSAGVGGGAAGLGISNVPIIGSALAAMAATVPYVFATSRMERHRQAVTAAWPDFITLLRGQLAGGAHLPAAFVAASETCPSGLAAAVQAAATRIRAGADFVVVVHNLRIRLADPVADRVLLTLIQAHRSGSRRVSELLGMLGVSVADELRLRGAHHAAMTQQRLTALVALAAPWVLLLLTAATNPQAREAYATGPGPFIIGAGGLATALGFWLAHRTARLGQPARVFT